ncbi:kelch-like protein diablo [Oscarella lobularis]|uniref:kelch-like protein diablo n=1 Tax=Oscarella lobularis TaxID=121494 RepID=UPI00331338FB
MAKTIAFTRDSAPSATVVSLDSFRVSNYLCDVVIVSKDGQRFPAHKIMLASASQFFHAMFSGSFLEGNQSEVAMGTVDGEVTKMLIEYAYTGKTECPASFDVVLSLYAAAHYVQFDELLNSCSKWLRRHVDVSDCLSLSIVADRYGDLRLLQLCDRVAAENVLLLAEKEEFLSLSVEHLSRIIAQDHLGVKFEDDVLIILRKWIEHDEESRRDHVETLSKYVRFPLIDLQKSSSVLSRLNLVSHCQSPDASCQRRIGGDGFLLVAGGKFEEDCGPYPPKDVAVRDVYVYDANNDKWASFPPLAEKIANHKIATSRGVTYVLGGKVSYKFNFDEDALTKTNAVQRYDAERRKWVMCKGKHMSCERQGFEIVSFDDSIYGMSLESWRGAMCEVFDPEKQAWIPLSSPVDSFDNRYIICSLDERIFAIGFNRRGELGYMKYVPYEDRWCEFKSCPLPANSDIEFGDVSLSDALDPMSCVYVTVKNKLYINVRNTNSAAVFDGHNERFSVADKFFPFASLGLAYDLDSKRMYCLGDEENQMAVYDERISKWDRRRLRNNYDHAAFDFDLTAFDFDLTAFDCVVVDRSLMQNCVRYR